MEIYYFVSVIKANNSQNVLEILAVLGAGFSCSSAEELQEVFKLGHISSVIFSQTIKAPSHIRFANKNDVDLMTFDSESELHKIKAFHPNARFVFVLFISCFIKSTVLK